MPHCRPNYRPEGTMRITEVEPILLRGSERYGTASGSGEATDNGDWQLLVRVATDEGLTGWADVETLAPAAVAIIAGDGMATLGFRGLGLCREGVPRRQIRLGRLRRGCRPRPRAGRGGARGARSRAHAARRSRLVSDRLEKARADAQPARGAGAVRVARRVRCRLDRGFHPSRALRRIRLYPRAQPGADRRRRAGGDDLGFRALHPRRLRRCHPARSLALWRGEPRRLRRAPLP